VFDPWLVSFSSLSVAEVVAVRKDDREALSADLILWTDPSGLTAAELCGTFEKRKELAAIPFVAAQEGGNRSEVNRPMSTDKPCRQTKRRRSHMHSADDLGEISVIELRDIGLLRKLRTPGARSILWCHRNVQSIVGKIG